MSNSNTFINSYASNIRQLVDLLNTLQSQNLQITDDPTLVTRYFSQTAPLPRNDIVAADVTNAQAAIVQMLFTYNSGSPTQASQLLKMTP